MPESVAAADACMPSAGTTPDVGPRALTFRFFELPYPNQSAIVSRLGLSSEADANKPASIRFSHALRRAKDRGLLPSLAAEIAKEEQTL